MDNCLWVQWKKPTDASRFVIDGEPSEYAGLKIQDNVVKLLSKVSKLRKINIETDDCIHSPSFRYSQGKINGEWFFCIEGNFKETDVAERNLVYMFLTKETDRNKQVEILKNYCSKLNVNPFDTDINTILNSKNVLKINKLCLIISITICLLLFLLRLLNKK